MNEVMEDDGARQPWLEKDFEEPMPTGMEKQDNKYVTPVEFKEQAIVNLRRMVNELKTERAELKNTIQDMRRSIFRPAQVEKETRDEELALLHTEKAALEEKVKGLESRNEQMVNVVDHLSKVVKNTNRVRTTSNEDFTKLVQDRIKQCTDVLFVKNKEYSSDTDRLHNFKVAGQFLGSHPVQALKGMMVKHEVSLFDMCCDVIAGKQPPSYILMDEKFGDIHNYYFLLEALLEEYRDVKR